MDVGALEKMLERGQDGAMVRYTLGTALAKEKRHTEAVTHLRQAVAMDADYSAAWQALGRSHQSLGDTEQALTTYRRGLEVAERCGDMQVVRALRARVRRLEQRGR